MLFPFETPAVQNERQPRNTTQVKPDSLIAYIKDGATVSVMHSNLTSKHPHNNTSSGPTNNNNNNNSGDQGFSVDSYNNNDEATNRYAIYNDQLDADRMHSKQRKSTNAAKSGPLPKRLKRRAEHSFEEDENKLQEPAMDKFSPNKLNKSNPSVALFPGQNGYFFESGKLFGASRLLGQQQQQPSLALPNNSFSSNSSSSSSSSSASSSASSQQMPAGNFLQQLANMQQQGNSESIQEASARLLFSSIKWCKSLPSFTALPLRDQVSKNCKAFEMGVLLVSILF